MLKGYLQYMHVIHAQLANRAASIICFQISLQCQESIHEQQKLFCNNCHEAVIVCR
jgi:hypothetical protein